MPILITPALRSCDRPTEAVWPRATTALAATLPRVMVARNCRRVVAGMSMEPLLFLPGFARLRSDSLSDVRYIRLLCQTLPHVAPCRLRPPDPCGRRTSPGVSPGVNLDEPQQAPPAIRAGAARLRVPLAQARRRLAHGLELLVRFVEVHGVLDGGGEPAVRVED